MSSGLRRGIIAALAAAILMVAGCGLAVVFRDAIACHLPLIECLGREGELFVRNDRADTVTVRSGSFSTTVSPGQMRTLASLGCGNSELVATDATGADVSRWTPAGECITRTWIFHADGTAQLVAGHAP